MSPKQNSTNKTLRPSVQCKESNDNDSLPRGKNRVLTLAQLPTKGLKILVIGLINFYRIFISPLKAPSCRFIPTCSQYTLEAVERYGVLKGIYLAIGRLLRCHPFCPGGYDPVK
ncbi:MAG: membrane protein insertion efficiency factor YidD [Acidobacteria bacterium]|nr:membrane protein insertion efficiency factor YidD [Acidobacteriota bacterium]